MVLVLGENLIMRMNTSPFFIPTGKEKDSEEAALIDLSNHSLKESFSEDSLQELIFEHPELLPITAFEPSFSEIIPVCRELPMPAGRLDNLYVTPQGSLILVECKLWRNPEARRKVISQIMDYAKDIAEWSYDDLAEAINAKNGTNNENPLYAIVKESPETPAEHIFVDQVSRNLALGRHLLLIVGDGIQEGAENLANFLQQNMGLHFTLGLLEMGIFKLPNKDGLIVIPSVIAKTTIIERGVIRFENGAYKLTMPKAQKDGTKITRAENLSEIEFFEALAQHQTNSADWLKRTLKKMEPYGVTWEVKQRLLPRFCPDGEHEFSLGYFMTEGQYITSNVTWELRKLGLEELGIEYIKGIANIIPDATVKISPKKGDLKIYIHDRVLNISDLVNYEGVFIQAVEKFIQSVAGRL